MSPKSFVLTLGIFFVDAGEKYFHLQSSTYKTDSNGYIICSPEKPKITNADLGALTLNASDQ
jgi:hypothetical protein